MTTVVPKVPVWLGLNLAALTASLAHVFVDTHLGLFGVSSPIMSALQAGNCRGSRHRGHCFRRFTAYQRLRPCLRCREP